MSSVVISGSRPFYPLGLGLFAALSSACWGSDPAEETPTELAPVEVTATHFSQPEFATPASVSVLDYSALRAGLTLTLPQALEQIPGLTFSSTGGYLQRDPQLRGFGGQRVLVLVDGLELNPPDMGALDWSLVPLGAVERVEVLRGGQSTIYGSRALAGVIKVTTRLDKVPQASLGATVGSDHLGRAQVQAGGGRGPWASFLGYEHLEGDGWRDNAAFRSDTAHGAVGYHFANAPWALQLRLQYADTWQQYPGPLSGSDGGAAFPDNPQQSTNLTSYTDAEITGAHLTAEGREFLNGEFEGSLSAQRRDGFWELEGIQGAPILDRYAFHPRQRWDWDAWQLTAGLDGEADRLDFTQYSTSATPADAPISQADIRQNALAGYTHARWNLAPDWALEVGVRGESARLQANQSTTHPINPGPLEPIYTGSKDDTGLAGTLGLNWQPWEDVHLWLRGDRVYRYPSIDEVAAYQGINLDTPFNEDLEPEHGYGLELGAGRTWDRWVIEGTLYGLWLQNEIEFDPIRYLNSNLAPTRRLGIEASVRRDWEPVTLTLSGLLQQAVYTEGAYAGNDRHLVPPALVQAGIDWRFWRGWTLGLSGRWVAAQVSGNDFENTEPKLPAYAAARASLGWSPRPWLRLDASVDNLFDAEYATTKYDGQWYPADGRSFRLGCTLRY